VGDRLAGKKNNRWLYSTKPERQGFFSAMHIISLGVVLQLYLYETLPEIVYRYFKVFPEFGYSASDESHYIIGNTVMIISSAAASLITGAFIVLCMKKFAPKPAGASKADGGGPISFSFKLPKNTFALLAVGLCIVQLSVFLYIAFNHGLYSVFGIESQVSSESYFPQTAAGIIVFFLAAVVAPSIFEEFIFRYVMLNYLKKYGNAFAIITTSVLFGFAHARVSAFIYATAIGLFSAYIAIKTKSVWFPVILHAAVNGMTFVFQYLSSQLLSEQTLVDIIHFAYLSFISAVSFVYLLVLVIRRKNTGLAAPGKHIYISNGRKLLLFFNAASLLFFILTILKSAEEYVF